MPNDMLEVFIPSCLDADVQDNQDADTKTVDDDSKKETSDSKKAKNKKRKEEKEDDDGLKKAKKPRVKPERVKEVTQKIIEELAKNYGFGLNEVPMDTLAAAVGYKHPRSDAILAAMKELKATGVATKNTKTNTCQLTEQGIKEYTKEIEPAANADAAMEQFWKQLEMKLASSEKSKGAKVHEAATTIWDLLKDGKAHAMKDVVKVTSYGMERSTGFGEIMKALKELGFTHKVDKKLQFTDKVFPFGRP